MRIVLQRALTVVGKSPGRQARPCSSTATRKPKRAKRQRRTRQTVHPVHEPVKEPPAWSGKLGSELRQRCRLATGITHGLRFGIGAKNLDRFADRVTPATKDHAQNVTDYPHDATRLRCCASLR